MDYCDCSAILAFALDGLHSVTCSACNCEMWQRLLRLRRWSEGLKTAANRTSKRPGTRTSIHYNLIRYSGLPE
jgi:hypothetical protein